MRRFPIAAVVVVVSLVLAAPRSVHAQKLRDQISGLFIFGPGQDPLFLAGSADPDNPISIQVHGSHFVPASAAENASVLSFITDAIGGRVASMPVGSTSSGETFRFEGGVPVPTSTSAGPIFAERALTLGRGRGLAGISHSGFHLQSLRGVDLHNVQLTFTHQNVDFPGCDAVSGGDCTLMGVPNLENDVIQVRMSLDLDVRVTSFYMTYGLTDRFDIGAVIPVVQTTLRGESFAQIQPFGGTSVAHFFAGTPTNPVLSATRVTEGSATGLGDVSVRAKMSLRESPRTSAALLADARFATGSAADLLGSGAFAARGLAIVTTHIADVSTHANLGYGYRGGRQQNDAVLATIGFDDQMTRHVTLAAEVLSELQVGDSRLQLPKVVTYEAPFRRTVNPTEIPDARDDIVNGSFGFKVTPRRDLIGVINALFPLNRGGLRPGVTYTAGLEFVF